MKNTISKQDIIIIISEFGKCNQLYINDMILKVYGVSCPPDYYECNKRCSIEKSI
jgi:hypothetical protein